MSAECSTEHFPPGYKQTEVGVIPKDWEVVNAVDACSKIQDGTHFSPRVHGNDFLYITSKNIRFGYLDISTASRIDTVQHQVIYRRCDVKKGDLLLTKDGASTGNAALNTLDEEFSLLSSVAFLRFHQNRYTAAYFLQQILTYQGQHQIQDAMAGNAITRLTLEKIKKLRFPVPSSLTEQEAIAEALSDADALIESLEQLIVKKRQIKQGAMQELLTGKRRLPEFVTKPRYKQTEIGIIPEDWGLQPLGELITFLDGKRRPVKDADRAKMRGSIPYYGASGIVDYVNDYLFNEDLILLGEDGENILSRACPLAFRISGKAWVNNHAHVLRPNPDISIGFLTDYLESLNYERFNSGTAQPKLNKQTCYGILIALPSNKAEQKVIANILADMDSEITALDQKLTKARQIKQAMMQELLTGRIRLI